MQEPPNITPQYSQFQQPAQTQPTYTQPQTYYPSQQNGQQSKPPQPQQQWEQPDDGQLPTKSKTLDRTFWILVGVSIGLVFGLVFGSFYGRSATTTSSTTTTQDTTQSTSQSQPTQAATLDYATPTPSIFSVGVPVTSGIWVITVNNAKTSTGDEFDTPKAGNIYLLLNFTAKNSDTSNHDMSPIYFTLRDNQGNTYALAYITVPSDPRGAVVAGQQLRGDLSYEVPKSLHSFILQFDPPDDTDDSQIVQWTIQI